MILASMRLENPNLNNYLHEKNMSPSPTCECRKNETTEHYLHKCPTYRNQRSTMIDNITKLTDKRITISILLEGNVDLDPNTNAKLICETVKFIKDSHRFE